MAKIIVKDANGTHITDFVAHEEESLATQAQDNGASVPVSCGVGACRACVGKVTKGQEHINTEALGPQHVPTEDNEILTCICALKPETPDNAEIEIEMENL